MLCWLIVDDSDVIRKVARRVLEDMNYLVLEAESGEAALEQCSRAMPEVILLDWHMPGMSGHDFLAALKSSPSPQRPVVVYCTTDNNAEDLGRAFSGGAQAFMMKPFNRAMLKEKIAEVALLAA